MSSKKIYIIYLTMVLIDYKHGRENKILNDSKYIK